MFEKVMKALAIVVLISLVSCVVREVRVSDKRHHKVMAEQTPEKEENAHLPYDPNDPQLTICSTAPRGLSKNDIGKPYDINFQRLSGAGGAPLFTSVPTMMTVKQRDFEHNVYKADDVLSVKANLSAWGLYKAGIELENENRYMSYRAYQTHSVVTLDDAQQMRNLLGGERYYLYKITFGFQYEMVLYENKSVLHAGVTASFPTIQGSINAFASENRLRHKYVGRGMRAKNKKAIFASTKSAIESSYEIDEKTPVAIFACYRTVQGVEKPKNKMVRFETPKFGDGDYLIRIKSATINLAWSDLEPKVCLKTGRDKYQRFCSKVNMNESGRNPKWEYKALIRLKKNDKLIFTILEDDAFADDLIGVCETESIRDFVSNRKTIKKCGHATDLRIQVEMTEK